MATGAQVRTWSGPSRRRVPRFQVQMPVDVTVLRSGIPDTVPGRSLNVCERGIAAVLAGEVLPGETVGIEVRLASAIDSLRARALVRYQDKLRCGLEFVGLSAEQRAAIREWAKDAKAENDAGTGMVAGVAKTSADAGEASVRASIGLASTAPNSGRPTSISVTAGGSAPQKQRTKRSRRGLGIFLVIVAFTAFAAGVFWWRWNRGWEELELGLKNAGIATNEKPTQVSTEVMQKLLIHRVEPAYPPEARKENLQGIIALDIVVGRDGSVIGVRALNGPAVLAKAAIDALRWWKFEPYRVNGETAVVETTLAVEFKR